MDFAPKEKFHQLRVQRNSILCSAVAAQAAARGSLSVSTAGRDAFLPAVCLSWSLLCILQVPQVSAVEGDIQGVPLFSGKVTRGHDGEPAWPSAGNASATLRG